MIKIKDFMVKNVITVDSKKTVYEASKIMAAHNVSCIIVTEKNKPLGVITERTVVQKIIVEQKDPKKTKAKDAMHDLITMDQEEDFFSLAEFMRKEHARRMVIVNKGKLTGIVTETDIVRTSLELQKELNDKKHKDKDVLMKKLDSIQKGIRKMDIGYKDLNHVLNGGFPYGKSILLVGPPGSGKGLIAFRFMKTGLKEKGKVIYLCMNELLKDIKELFSTMNVNIEKYMIKGDFNLINLYEEVIDGSQKLYNEEEQLLVKEFGIIRRKIEDIVKEAHAPVRCVVNVISQSLVMQNPKTVYKFILMLNNLLKEHGITTLYFMHEPQGSEEDPNLVMMEELMDGSLEFNIKEKNAKIEREITLKKMKPEFSVLPQFFSYEYDKEKHLIVKRMPN